MKSAKAPAGFHADVRVHVTLQNGTTHAYRWSTPMAISPALHKALTWAKDAMTKEKVVGRSKIVGLEVSAKYLRGEYTE